MDAEEVAKLRTLHAEIVGGTTKDSPGFHEEVNCKVCDGCDWELSACHCGLYARQKVEKEWEAACRRYVPILLDELDALSASGRKLAKAASDAAVEIARLEELVRDQDEMLAAARDEVARLRKEVVVLNELPDRDAAAMVEFRAKLAVADSRHIGNCAAMTTLHRACVAAREEAGDLREKLAVAVEALDLIQKAPLTGAGWDSVDSGAVACRAIAKIRGGV